jgi:hypothetical protein
VVRDVLSATLGDYRRLFRSLVPLTALIYVPFVLALLALQILVPETGSTRQNIAIIDVAGSVLLFQPLATIISIRAAQRLDQDESAVVRREIGPAFAILAPFVLTQLLVLAIIVLIPGLFIVGGLAFQAPLIALIGVGMLLASLVINGVRMWLTTAVVVVEDARYTSAIRRSVAITQGGFWVILLVIIALALLTLVITIAAALPSALLEPGPALAVGERIGGLVAAALSVPLIALGAYRLYLARTADQGQASA